MKSLTTYQIDLSEEKTTVENIARNSSDVFTLLEVNIGRSNYQYTTTRIYSNVYGGLSSIGGIFSLVFGVIGIMAALYTRRAFLVSVANELYDFEIPEYLEQKKRLSWRSRFSNCLKRKPKQSQADLEAGSPMVMRLGNQDAKQTENFEKKSREYFEKTTKKKRTLSYGFLDFLLSILCWGRREKDRFVKRAVDTVNRDTDVLHLIQGLHENERLKKILLSKEQQDLFSYSCHPVIVTKDLWRKPKAKPKSKSSAKKSAEKSSVDGVIVDVSQGERSPGVKPLAERALSMDVSFDKSSAGGSPRNTGNKERGIKKSLSKFSAMGKGGEEGVDLSVDRSPSASPSRPKKPNTRSFKKTPTMFDKKIMKTAHVQTEEEIRNNQYSEFLALCKSYKKVFRESSQPLNYKILELLDENLHEALYEMAQHVRENKKGAQEDDTRPGNQTVLLVKRSHMHSKLAAAMKISRQLKLKILRRRQEKQDLLDAQKKNPVQLQFYSEGEEVKSFSDNRNVLNMSPSMTNPYQYSDEDVDNEDIMANSPFRVNKRSESKLSKRAVKTEFKDE